MFFLNINAKVEIGNFYLFKLSKILITTILDFCLFILNFHLKILANHFFFFKIFSIIFKKSSRLLIEPLFKMRFKIISYYCLASDMFLVLFICLENIKDKGVLICI